MKKNRIFLYFASILSYIATILFIPSLPDRIPTHFDYRWQVDGYGSRYTLLLLGAMPLILTVIFDIVPKIDPKKKYKDKQDKVYGIFAFVVWLLLFFMNWFTVMLAKGIQLNVRVAMSFVLGILFIVIGNYTPKIKWNYFIGVRTPWTLASELCWKKTHRISGYVFVLFGVLWMLSAVITAAWYGIFCGAVLMGATVGLIIYSYIVYKKEEK